MSARTRSLLCGFAFGLAETSLQACDVDISDYVGWTIIYSGTVTGYVNDNGEKVDGFEGCDHGRALIVDYSSTVECAEYSYSYAYRPEIVVLQNGTRMAACIDDDMYSIRR